MVRDGIHFNGSVLKIVTVSFVTKLSSSVAGMAGEMARDSGVGYQGLLLLILFIGL